MAYDPDRHHRRSIRLRDYDYTEPGPYFVTICTHRRMHLFGDVVDGIMRANAYGCIAVACWHALPNHFPNVVLDAFVVMPNHVHGIIGIANAHVGATHASPLRFGTPPPPSSGTPPPPSSDTPPPPSSGTRPSLGAIIGSFKSAVTKHINRGRGMAGASVWQRNYYEHIIRNERALNRIRRYIIQNPPRWSRDRNNPG